MKSAWLIALCLVAGCASFDSKGPSGRLSGTTRTFAAPIARVKPAFKRVEIEIERLGAASTRVRVTGSDHDQIMRKTEKRIGGG